MQRRVPRLVLAGTNSGCGKTTVTCAVLQALVTRGLRVGAAKCGPDYIDPMFHSRVIGAKSSNLDSFFFDRDTMRYLLAHNTQGCDVTVIEGVMGYYDGLGLTSTRASTYAAARETSSPVVLVVNARGAALSVLASVEGFLHFAPDSGIQGVILNGCSAMSYGPLSRELENRLGVRACGYLPRLPECALESRHLGLITADEVADLQEKLRKLAQHKQVLCVTHLPQMAALADTHMLISKCERDGRTYTSVTPLDTEGRKRELARIIGGTHITETTLKSAEEMLRFEENQAQR